MDGWIALLHKIADMPGVDMFLPGHGDVGMRDDVLDEANMLAEVQKTVKAAIAQVLEEPGLELFVAELSLDGMPAFHDAFRVAPGSFKRAMETYDALAALHVVQARAVRTRGRLAYGPRDRGERLRMLRLERGSLDDEVGGHLIPCG